MTTAGKPQAKVKIDALGLGLGVRELYAEPTNPPPTRLFTEDLGWDKQATHTEDVDSFLPVNRLSEYAATAVSGRCHPASTEYQPITAKAGRHSAMPPRSLNGVLRTALDAVLLSAL